MNKRAILIAGISFPLLVGLLLIFRDFIREAILLPVLYFFWLGRLLLFSLDQKYLWAVLVVAAGAVLISTLKTKGKAEEEGDPGGRTPSSRGRVGFWVTRIQQSYHRGYSTQSLMQELGNLVVSVLAEREKSSPRQIQEQVERGELVLPAAVQNCVLARNQGFAPEMRRHPMQWILRGFRAFRLPALGRGNVEEKAALEQTLESVADYLELGLEKKHD
jgi:hypothetical protein